MKKEIYALGVGRGTPIFIELAEACGYVVKGLYHYNSTRTGNIDHGLPVLGSFEDLYNTDIKGKNFMLTMGDMSIKQEISDRLVKWGGGNSYINSSIIYSISFCNNIRERSTYLFTV